MTEPGAVVEAVARLHERIAGAGGDVDRIRVVAVTKGFGAEAVEAAASAGLTEVGESYAQELRRKASQVRAAVRWHFVGRVQSNKVRLVADLVELWHSVDRASVADELARRAPGARALVQVNVTGEPSKAGCAPTEASALVEHLRQVGVDVRGLMAVGRIGSPEATRAGFRLLAGLADELQLPERSMGMSADLEAAVAEGATIVRVGRALFGDRPGPRVC